MKFVADLHLHSKYSRAVSKDMSLPIMNAWAKRKGIDILATGDFTHPLWFREIRSQLEEAGEGLYRLKSGISNSKSQINANNQREPLFLLSVEISSIYSDKGKLRRIHNLLFAPNFETASKINEELRKRGCNISSDGRPIIGISSRNLLELVLGIDKRIIFIPCHIWTPHFGMYGSASGYDSIEESFGELSKYIYGIETGLSSDPIMNWQIPELDHRAILSFSDAHSPAKMGREATVFSIEKNGMSNKEKINYMDIGKAIAKPDESTNIAYTLEFYPEEGKYHYTGHRNCKVVLSPQESKDKGQICPLCNRKLTEGVLYRVEQIAGSSFNLSEKTTSDTNNTRWIIDPKGKRPKYVKLVPLLEIVAEALESTVASGKVRLLYDTLLEQVAPEIEVLLSSPISEIAQVVGEKIAEGVSKVRAGTIVVDPGFDGEYGKVKIWNNKDVALQPNSATITQQESQLGLF